MGAYHSWSALNGVSGAGSKNLDKQVTGALETKLLQCNPNGGGVQNGRALANIWILPDFQSRNGGHRKGGEKPKPETGGLCGLRGSLGLEASSCDPTS